MTDRLGAVERWLETRLAEVPAELARAVRAAASPCAEEGPGPLAGGETPGAAAVPGEAEGLAAAALRELEAVAGSARDRGAALRLLAADALLTYAFEAASDPELGGGAEGAAALARRLGPRGELGARLVGAPRIGRGGRAPERSASGVDGS